jgi:dissimilatory sulfite reductase (desulfoviridin) alpha/beta subunit
MHCINVMPRALHIGDDRGCSMLAGAKAPILDGAQMGSLLVPFIKVEEPYDEIKEVIEGIWDWWMEEGKNRERLGELMKRQGFQKLLEATGFEPVPQHVQEPRPTPTSSGKRKRWKAAGTVTSTNSENTIRDKGGITMAFISSGYNPDKPMENRITDIGPQQIRRVLSAGHRQEQGQMAVSRNPQTRCPGPRGRIRRRGLHRSLGGARLMSVTHIREICEIADKHCDGHLRFTTRNNIEFMVDSKDKVEPLVKDLESRKFDGGSFKFPVGGTGAGVTNIVHTQGWIHCHTPATDASGPVKADHGRAVRRLQGHRLPAQLRVSLACCLNMCGAVHCSDIAILGYHRKPPMLDHEYLDKMCEIPWPSPPAPPPPSSRPR